jgi:hypothetical protein
VHCLAKNGAKGQAQPNRTVMSDSRQGTKYSERTRQDYSLCQNFTDPRKSLELFPKYCIFCLFRLEYLMTFTWKVLKSKDIIPWDVSLANCSPPCAASHIYEAKLGLCWRHICSIVGGIPLLDARQYARCRVGPFQFYLIC